MRLFSGWPSVEYNDGFDMNIGTFMPWNWANHSWSEPFGTQDSPAHKQLVCRIQKRAKGGPFARNKRWVRILTQQLFPQAAISAILGPGIVSVHEGFVSGFGFRVSGFGFRVSGFGWGVTFSASSHWMKSSRTAIVLCVSSSASEAHAAMGK